MYVSGNSENLLPKHNPNILRIEKSRKYKVVKEALNFDSLAYGQADVQVKMLGLENYHKRGFTGRGVKIALFDAGFYKLDSIKAFDSLLKRNGILAKRDFPSQNSNVYDDDAHGMYVLSLISGYVKDSLTGTAPDANFVLARTEIVSSETHMEEFYWIKAMEWADSIGVDIIHSSLGYSNFDTLQGNYTYQDMDGESTIITRAAQMAYQKGIFITNSAGNEGAKKWRYITAPCDGKDVLCIGAVDSFRNHAKFSSFGPSADGRVKPDVVAMGHNVTIIGANNNMRRGSGTSFSGPIMAGFVACLKQAFPTVSNKVMLDAIRQSGHLYKTPNDSLGYGIPNILRADSILRKKLGLNQVQQQASISLSPNPAENEIFINCPNPIQLVAISDLNGQIVRTEGSSKVLYIQYLNPGIYYVQIVTQEGKKYYQKFIKL